MTDPILLARELVASDHTRDDVRDVASALLRYFADCNVRQIAAMEIERSLYDLSRHVQEHGRVDKLVSAEIAMRELGLWRGEPEPAIEPGPGF